MDGSWSALITKKIYNKKLVLRTGYTWSKLKEVTEPNSILKIKFIKFMEKMMYKNCDIAIVSSYNNKQYLNQKYGCDNINVLYNYVDLNKFYDLETSRAKDSIVFIGRLSDEKNIFSLIEASNKCNLNLKIYGDGPLREKLEQYINKNTFNTTLMGSVPNSEISKILNENKYYALVSFQEGMPKSLMEAMACGCVCIGTDTDGINELIEDEVNGFLAKDFDARAIEVAITMATNSNQDEILKNATTFSKKYFDIKNIVLQEYRIFKELL
jgi:glycosyltransferase involved in cell wall biosynthesis